MTQDFDKFISESAPRVPDSGPSSRVTRVLLHERIRQDARRRRVRHFRGTTLVACLVFLFVFGDQVSELGSDGFDVETRFYEIEGTGKFILTENPFREVRTSFPEGTSREYIDEINQVIAADERTPFKLEGLCVEGKTIWTMHYKLVINGEEQSVAGNPKNLLGYKSEISDRTFTFMAEHYSDFLLLIEKNRIPGKAYDLIRSNGLVFHVYSWTRSYPEYGNVTYFTGEPRAQ